MLLHNNLTNVSLNIDKQRDIKRIINTSQPLKKIPLITNEPLITQVIKYKGDVLENQNKCLAPLYGVLDSLPPSKPPFLSLSDISPSFHSYPLILQSIDKQFMSVANINGTQKFKAKENIKKIHFLILLSRIMHDKYPNLKAQKQQKIINSLPFFEKR